MNTGALKRLAIWLLVLSTWEAAYRLVQWPAWVFPAPSHVLDATLNLLDVHTFFGDPLHRGWPMTTINGEHGREAGNVIVSPLVTANLVSALRLVVGFSLSGCLGIIIGSAMWRFRGLDEFLGPLFLGLQTLPSVCWVPLAIILFGLRESGILFVLIMGSFFAIAIALRDGLRTIPPAWQSAGRMLGAKGWRLWRYVLIPASLPALAASLRQGFSFAWRSLMGAELIFAVQRHGLGYLLEAGRTNADVAQVVAVMMLMVMLGMLADLFAFARLERRIHRRFGLAPAH